MEAIKMAKMNPVVHFEMPYGNGERLMKFYTQVFGWQMNKTGKDMGYYVLAYTAETDKNMMVKTPGAINGGFFRKQDAPGSRTSVVIAVDDIDKAMKKVTAAGGKILGKPMDIPGVGKFVSFKDSEGNKASMLQPLMGKE